MYWNLTTGGVGQRAVGCPGLDEPFGEVTEYGTPNWPYKTGKRLKKVNEEGDPIFGSPAMDCPTNDVQPRWRESHNERHHSRVCRGQ